MSDFETIKLVLEALMVVALFVVAFAVLRHGK